MSEISQEKQIRESEIGGEVSVILAEMAGETGVYGRTMMAGENEMPGGARMARESEMPGRTRMTG